MVLVRDTSSYFSFTTVLSFILTALMVVKLQSGHEIALQMIKGK